MDIHIDCACGTRYAFEVEPVDGQMPFTVQCPKCGADGTVAANETIQAGQARSESSAQLEPPEACPAQAVSWHSVVT